MFLTRKHLSRRAVLKGLAATVGLPYLEAMEPAGRALRAAPPNLVCIEMVHGAAGSTPWGIAQHLWAPAETGTVFDLTPTSLRSLAPFQHLLTIVSQTDVENAEPFEAREIGGDHFRSSAVFLTQSHPKRTAGADVEAGTSLDQLYAQRFGQDTPLPSVQMCIENGDQGGGCGFGYSCAYVDTISWATPTTPLPMLRDPRAVFDQLFGAFGHGATAAARQSDRRTRRSLLDWIGESIQRLSLTLGPVDRARLDHYLTSVREVERRIQTIEAHSATGAPREIPDAPAAVPDSFAAHVEVMFDLQALALAAGVTRVIAFKLGRDASNRVYPESGVAGGFHPVSHHNEREPGIRDFARLNAYHVSRLPYFLARLAELPEARGALLDNTVVLYGSPMGDSHMHTHESVPFFLAGCAGGRLKGGRHLRAPRGTPLANVMLSLLHALGRDDLETFGDSAATFDLNA
jgi:hypothetical protein